jgi:hypothetical protein
MLDRLLRVTVAARDLFWIGALGVLLIFGFFLALGAVHPGEMKWPTIGVIALGVLWVVHAWLQGRQQSARDPRMVQASERRGF